MSASTFSTLVSFPGQGSIPPACFYTTQGLAGWLNNNPTYKQWFGFTNAFPYLYPPIYAPSTMSSISYNPQTVPLCSPVTTLSHNQAHKYYSQLQLFQKVYTTNSNAYITYISTGNTPVYYTFSSFTEKYEYNSAVQLVNKLYPFQAMAEAPTVNWQIPFPINM